MKKFILAAIALAFLTSPSFAARSTGICDTTSCLIERTTICDSTSCQDYYAMTVKNDLLYDPTTFAQGRQYAQAATSTTTKTETPVAPASVTTTVKGGTLAAQILEWFQVAFGGAIATAVLVLITKGLDWFKIQTTDGQRKQLQEIVVNGLNDAAAKAGASLRATDKLDIALKGQIVADAIDYTQRHAPDTIKALGLDPKSGEAVEAIRARIETALNDPATPTPAAITPETGKPVVSGVIVEGTRV